MMNLFSQLGFYQMDRFRSTAGSSSGFRPATATRWRSWLIPFAWAVASVAPALAVDDGAGPAAPLPPPVAGSLARVDSLLAVGRAEAALPLALAAHDRWLEDPVYGWQVEARAGAAFLDAGRPAEALPYLERACRLRPDQGSLHHLLGQTLQRLGRSGRALAEFDEAARLSPDDPAPLLEAGRLRAELGDLGRACLAFEAARVACDGCPQADRLLGSALLAAGRPEEAITPLTRLWQAAPDSLVRRHLLAALAGARRDSAVLALVGGSPEKERTRDDWRLAVQAEGRLGRADWAGAAVAVAKGAPQAFPEDDALFWAQASLNLERVGNLPGALTAVDRAIGLAPGRSVFHHNRAAVLAALGRHDEARAALETSRSLEAADSTRKGP